MTIPGDNRPDPDSLLAMVQLQESKEQRGKLRIYFGSSAGVGKTFAMLLAARKLKSEGCDAVVGIVETHGRAETSALLEGLEILPLKRVAYRGKSLTDFGIGALTKLAAGGAVP
jgi:two-component system sensor histidine kinase KdpD